MPLTGNRTVPAVQGDLVKRFLRAACAGTGLAILFAGSQVYAAVAVDVVRVDLKPLIRGAMASPSQFAVPLAHPASLTASGAWTVADGRAQWHYSAQVPGAVSLSFLATQVMLPADATLSVRAGTTLVRYRARDLHRGSLWSRISPGDMIEFTLDVAASERGAWCWTSPCCRPATAALAQVLQTIPITGKLAVRQATAAGADNSACVQNYACSVSAANSAAGLATVGLVVGNLYQCTGTLVNDVPGDNAPYVLTARHCETGKLGGGNPGAASTVTVYWNAVTACGLALARCTTRTCPRRRGGECRGTTGCLAHPARLEPYRHRRPVRRL